MLFFIFIIKSEFLLGSILNGFYLWIYLREYNVFRFSEKVNILSQSVWLCPPSLICSCYDEQCGFDKAITIQKCLTKMKKFPVRGRKLQVAKQSKWPN